MTEPTTATTTDRPDECICHARDDLPCWPCYNDGFRVADPAGDGR